MSTHVKQILLGKFLELYGRTISKSEALSLVQNLPGLYLESLVEILIEFPLVGSELLLDKLHDESHYGVSMEWMSPQDMLDEAKKFQPGISAIVHGYLPIGTCLLGSGDPYFINFSEKEKDPRLVRIPHTSIDQSNNLIENQVEIVTQNLSTFLELCQYVG